MAREAAAEDALVREVIESGRLLRARGAAPAQ
jgi:hypothetical protein